MPETTTAHMSSEDRTQAEAYYHFMVASILEQEGNLDQAMSEYERAFTLDPKSAETAYSLAVLSLRKGRVDQSVQYAQKAVELQPDKTAAHMLLAGIYASRKKYDEAIAAYRSVIAIDPKQEEAYLYLGSLFASLKRYDDAIATFRTAEKVNPSSVMSPYYQGRIYLEQQMYDQAELGVIKNNARRRLRVLDSLDTADRLTEAVAAFAKRTGRRPQNLEALREARKTCLAGRRAARRW